MKPENELGIVGYGGYIPGFRMDSAEIDRVFKGADQKLHGHRYKAVAGPDEDTTTIAIQAARTALKMSGIDPEKIGAVWFGTESKPYAVKPTSTIIADAIGALPFATAADWEFACKPGTEAMHAAVAMVSSKMIKYAMVGGADTAQARPGDLLEYHTGSGGGAFIMGPPEESLALYQGSSIYVTNNYDFFRREGRMYPSHGQRFTGQPAYFQHITASVTALFDELGLGPKDFKYAIFHQPNRQFPLRVAKQLGFKTEQVEPFILTDKIGNTYSGAVLLAFAKALDEARPGDRILLASYGSGAGSDAFSFQTTELLPELRKKGIPISSYLAGRKEIDYALYAKYQNKLRLK